MPLNPIPWVDVFNKLRPEDLLNKDHNIVKCVIALIITVSIVSSLQGQITGLVPAEEETTVHVDKVLTESDFFTLPSPSITSLKISGSVTNGFARVYAEESDGSLALVFDSGSESNVVFNGACVETCQAMLSTAKLAIILRGENASFHLNNITYKTQVFSVESPRIDTVNVSVDDAVAQEFLKKRKVSVIIILKQNVNTAEKNKKKLLEEVKIDTTSAQHAVVADLQDKSDVPRGNQITGASVLDIPEETFTIHKEYEAVNALAAEITPEALEDLKNNPLVEAVIYDVLFNITTQDAVPLIRASDVHGLVSKRNEPVTGHGQSVCVLDTGVDYNHPALQGKTIGGINLVAGTTDPLDDHGHGTHVSGIVLATAPSAKVVPVKVCDSGGSCSGSTILSGIDYCINRALELNISVISASLGDSGSYDASNCPGYFDGSLALANTMGVSNVYSAGNNGYSNGVSYPACSPYSVSVGATTKQDAIAGFSNRGSRLDVFAPGVSINSTMKGGTYAFLSGTSMSAPFVAGALALLQQVAKAEQFVVNPSEGRDILKGTGVLIQSWPRIDVLSAVQELLRRSQNRTSVTLISPKNDSWINQTSPVFEWSKGSGVDKYTLTVSNTSDLSTILFVTSTKETKYALPTILSENVPYYWGVSAGGVNSMINRFMIDATPPIVSIKNLPPSGSGDLLLEWTADDAINQSVVCSPLIDGVVREGVVTQKNGNMSLNLSSGVHKLAVKCSDTVNTKESEEKTYIVGGIRITMPLNGTRVLPFMNVTMNVSETIGVDFIDRVVVTTGGIPAVVNEEVNNTWVGVSTIPNITPQRLPMTSIGYNEAQGIGFNVTQGITLLLDKPNPAVITSIFACANETFVVNGTQVMLRTIFDADTLIDRAYVLVETPSKITKEMTPESTMMNTDFRIETEYPLLIDEVGKYKITWFVSTIGQQLGNTSFSVMSGKKSGIVNISAPKSVITIRDVCSKTILAEGQDNKVIVLPVPSSVDIAVSQENVLFNISEWERTETTNIGIEYVKEKENISLPIGFTQVGVWDMMLSDFKYGDANLYLTYADTNITNENRLKLFRCLQGTKCVRAENATIETGANEVTMQYPNRLPVDRLVLGDPALLHGPIIKSFNMSKKYVGINDSVDIFVEVNLSTNVDAVKLYVKNNVVNAIDTTEISETHLKYHFAYTPIEIGEYPVKVEVVDQNGEGINSSRMFFASEALDAELNATGSESIVVQDIDSNKTLGEGFKQRLAKGRYHAQVRNASLDLSVVVKNFSIDDPHENIIEMKKAGFSFNAPPQSNVQDAFRIRSPVDYAGVEIVYNYGKHLNVTVGDDNISFMKCGENNLLAVSADTMSCSSWVDTNPEKDVVGNVLKTNVNSLSLFAVTTQQGTSVSQPAAPAPSSAAPSSRSSSAKSGSESSKSAASTGSESAATTSGSAMAVQDRFSVLEEEPPVELVVTKTCLKPQEFLGQVETALKEKDYTGAKVLVKDALTACDELSKYSPEVEQPGNIVDVDEFNHTIIAFVLVTVILGAIVFLRLQKKL